MTRAERIAELRGEQAEISRWKDRLTAKPRSPGKANWRGVPLCRRAECWRDANHAGPCAPPSPKEPT